MAELRAVCDQHGILLIVDEVQTGFARTGRMFAMEYEETEADIMTLAKGIAGGFALAAVVGKKAVMDAPDPGGLGGTFAGSPLACAAGLAVLEVIEKEALCERAVEIGELVRASLARLQLDYPDRIGDIRGTGAMVAMELVINNDVTQPDPELTRALVGKAADSGLMLLSCGVRSNVIRILVPLTIPMDQLDEGLNTLTKSFKACV